MDCQVVSSNPTVPKLQEQRVRGAQESYAGVWSMSVHPPGFGLCPTLLSAEGRWALAFPGSVLDGDSVAHPAAKKALATNKQEQKLRALGSQSPCLTDVTHFKTIGKARRGEKKDKRAACPGRNEVRETPGRGWTAGRPGKRQTSSRGARVSSLLCAPRGASLRRLSRPPGSAATGCGDRPAPRPRAPLSPHSPGDTHRLQEAQGAHVVPLGAQDLVEDAQAEAQLALRLPGGRARTGARRRGAGGPGVRMGTVLSPIASAAIAAAGYLHSSAAAWCRLLPPRGGRAERRLRGPSTPSRTGRAGSAAGRALGAAGGTGGGGPGWGRRQRARRLDQRREEAAFGAPRRRAPATRPPRERLPSATPR